MHGTDPLLKICTQVDSTPENKIKSHIIFKNLVFKKGRKMESSIFDVQLCAVNKVLQILTMDSMSA